MDSPLWVLAAVGIMGGYDTIVFHERVARLASQPAAWRELRLHAAREVVYLVLFSTLAWFAPHGWIAAALAIALAAEIVITAFDFIVEWDTRKLPRGERALHAIIAIAYGAFLALLAPRLAMWFRLPTGLTPVSHGVLSWFLSLLALGVAIWAVRDASAARYLRMIESRPELRPSLERF
ncbi:MAG: hypothetical protein JWN27_2080 [Candidatus Eremiobacteraeota bacterium]|nr:hypothetical protein [Candidatus Eremiobacteraeota bacterium]